MMPKNWFVIADKNGEFYAVEDKHGGVEPKMISGGEVVGICSFRKAIHAIEYVKFILSGGR
jgi:hypothetical protein